jgi:hypothetical protein
MDLLYSKQRITKSVAFAVRIIAVIARIVQKSNMRYLFILFLCLFMEAAQAGSLKDTVHLNEVVTFPIARNAKLYQVENNQSNTVDKLLLNSNSMFIKNYGAKALSSITYRGTSAAQNDFYWNGVKINSALTGQVDCSFISHRSKSAVLDFLCFKCYRSPSFDGR